MLRIFVLIFKKEVPPAVSAITPNRAVSYRADNAKANTTTH